MDTDKLIIEKKLESMGERVADVEYLVDGVAIGDTGMVPCVLESEAGEKCRIKVADGPFTGTQMEVPARYVVALGKGFFEDASTRLLK